MLSSAAVLLDGFLSILRECIPLAPDVQAIEVLLCKNDFSAPSQSLPSFSARSISVQEVIGFDLHE